MICGYRDEVTTRVKEARGHGDFARVSNDRRKDCVICLDYCLKPYVTTLSCHAIVHIAIPLQSTTAGVRQRTA